MFHIHSSWQTLLVALLFYIKPLCEGHTLIPESQVRYAIRLLPKLFKQAEHHLNHTLQREAAHVKYLKYYGYKSSNSFRMVQNILGATKQAKQMSYGAFIQIKTLKLLKKRLRLKKKAFEELIPKLPTLLQHNIYGVQPDDPKFRGTVRMCPYPAKVFCHHKYPYRTFDGSCNNKNWSLWGASFQPFARLMPADYADGIEIPRGGKYGAVLPSARLVSSHLLDDLDRPASAMTLLVMLMGQFVDHDLTRTAVSKLSNDETGFGAVSDVRCGSDGCQTTDIHHANCLPIGVPEKDPMFGGERCLEFVRTLCVPAATCQMGPRQQLNQITAYLDGSHIYGSTKHQADTLRDTRKKYRGKLKMRIHPTNSRYKKILPAWEEFSQSEDCKGSDSKIKCFQAGDGRVNEHLGLMSFHTLFARQHNRVERALHRVNPHWSGAKLYQEARRMVGAMWQHVVYNEYLPLVLGPEIVKFYGLEIQKHGYYDGYDPHIRADIANGFASAAFRYGHSQIQDVLKLMGADYTSRREMKLSSTFRSPAMLYQSHRPMADDIMRGYVGMRAQSVDNHVTEQVAGRLFAKDPPHGVGTDLGALNIQRAREHGIPGYARWREWCGLGRPKTFSDLTNLIPQKMVDRFAKIYRHVEDIDLFPAGLSEKPQHGAVVGPTFACILANQFQRTKRGDRFWYENRNQPHPFTKGQLREIRKTSLAKIVCDNSDKIKKIQPKALLRPFRELYNELRDTKKTDEVDKFYKMYHGAWNDRVSCYKLPSPDVSEWREKKPKRKIQARTMWQYSYNILKG